MSCCPRRRQIKDGDADDQCCWYEEKYAEKTTCHGLSCVFSHESYLAKAVWVCILTGFSAAMFYQAFLNLNEFLQFDTSTSIEREYSADIEFPAVTICNFNRFFKEIYTKEIPIEELYFNYYLNRVNSPTYYNNEWTTNYTIENEASKNLSTLVYSDYLREKGWGLDIALYDCYFGDESCWIENFTTIQTEMGQCFVFNGDNSSTNGRKQGSPGTNNGLRVWFDTQHWEYTEEEYAGIEDAGIKFLVHDPSITPNVLQYGHAVPPGSKAIAAVKKRRYDLAEKPYGQCDRDTKKLKYFPKYTMDGCLTECHTDLIIEECGCHTFYQGWADDVVKECSIVQLQKCATPALAQIRKTYSLNECNCSIPCVVEEYDVSISYGLWPGYQVVQSYKEQYPDSAIADFVRDNYVSLDIGFNIIGYEISTQSQSYTWQSLFSNFGGSFGLWTGVSMFTMVEFVYFLLKKLRFCILNENSATTGKRQKRNRCSHAESKYVNNSFHDTTLTTQPKSMSS